MSTESGFAPKPCLIAIYVRDLYIQALSAFQAMPEDQERSWFQVLGKTFPDDHYTAHPVLTRAL